MLASLTRHLVPSRSAMPPPAAPEPEPELRPPSLSQPSGESSASAAHRVTRPLPKRKRLHNTAPSPDPDRYSNASDAASIHSNAGDHQFPAADVEIHGSYTVSLASIDAMIKSVQENTSVFGNSGLVCAVAQLPPEEASEAISSIANADVTGSKAYEEFCRLSGLNWGNFVTGNHMDPARDDVTDINHSDVDDDSSDGRLDDRDRGDRGYDSGDLDFLVDTNTNNKKRKVPTLLGGAVAGLGGKGNSDGPGHVWVSRGADVSARVCDPGYDITATSYAYLRNKSPTGHVVFGRRKPPRRRPLSALIANENVISQIHVPSTFIDLKQDPADSKPRKAPKGKKSKRQIQTNATDPPEEEREPVKCVLPPMEIYNLYNPWLGLARDRQRLTTDSIPFLAHLPFENESPLLPEFPFTYHKPAYYFAEALKVLDGKRERLREILRRKKDDLAFRRRVVEVDNKMPASESAVGTPATEADNPAGGGKSRIPVKVTAPELLPPSATPAKNNSRKGKKKRSAHANANNAHHRQNYVPNRLPNSGARNQEKKPHDDELSSVATAFGFGAEEWMCMFCEYEMYYGEESKLLRCIRRRKKVLKIRKKAANRAKDAVEGRAPPPAPAKDDNSDKEPKEVPPPPSTPTLEQDFDPTRVVSPSPKKQPTNKANLVPPDPNAPPYAHLVYHCATKNLPTPKHSIESATAAVDSAYPRHCITLGNRRYTLKDRSQPVPSHEEESKLAQHVLQFLKKVESTYPKTPSPELAEAMANLEITLCRPQVLLLEEYVNLKKGTAPVYQHTDDGGMTLDVNGATFQISKEQCAKGWDAGKERLASRALKHFISSTAPHTKMPVA